MSLALIRDQLIADHGITRAVLDRGNNRRGSKDVCLQRRKLCYLLRTLPGCPSWSEIAKTMGVAHNSVVHGTQKYASDNNLPLEPGSFNCYRPKVATLPPRERPMYDDGDEP